MTRNKKLSKMRQKKFQKNLFQGSKILKNMKISGFSVISGLAQPRSGAKISEMKAFIMFYNISKNELTETYGKNRNHENTEFRQQVEKKFVLDC